MGRHYLDLAEARTVPTPGLVATHRAVADLLEAIGNPRYQILLNDPLRETSAA